MRQMRGLSRVNSARLKQLHGQTCQLKRRLRPLVNLKEWESVRFYPLCAECEKKVKVLGKDLARQLGTVEIV